MKNDEIKIEVVGLETDQDKSVFQQILADAQVEAVMKICPKELRLAVLNNALAILKGEEAVTK